MPTKGDNDAFVRWQSVTIAQLTQAVSVVLGFAVAALGFDVTLLISKDFSPTSWQKYAFSLGGFPLLASVGLGIWCIINRLRDFRATMKAAQEGSSTKANEARALAARLGKHTWALFWWQIGTFGTGIALTITVIVALNVGKLF